ncbi:NUDIX hydrolase [Dactylosporangium sp. CS-033363]|uniref:NUDIX hydrolase n=1 Tax=Dactylosporangium sp. CS-033363 TaxID=3239935 RepID=UPI003D94FE36
MSFRLAAYAVCLASDRVLLARCPPVWTLPGGGVEPSEDPFDAVIREVAEETGCRAEVTRLLGVDSRVIPAAQARLGIEHQNVGIFYEVRITGGALLEAEASWTALAEVPLLRRSSLVDVGLELARTLPPTGHVGPVAVGGLVEH